MLLGRMRTVHVSTPEELDAALKGADRVVVEGNEALLSYAIARTASDPAHDVDIQLPPAAAPPARAVPSPASPSFNAPMHVFVVPPDRVAAGFDNIFEQQSAPAAASGGGNARMRALVWIVVAALCAVAAGALGVFVWGSQQSAGPPTEERRLAPAPPPPQAGFGPHALSAPPETSHVQDVTMIQAIAWPAVAIIAILALALIARQAIAAGRTVEFSWKVTEKVSGRVVITRVKNPPHRKTAPA